MNRDTLVLLHSNAVDHWNIKDCSLSAWLSLKRIESNDHQHIVCQTNEMRISSFWNKKVYSSVSATALFWGFGKERLSSFGDFLWLSLCVLIWRTIGTMDESRRWQPSARRDEWNRLIIICSFEGRLTWNDLQSILNRPDLFFFVIFGCRGKLIFIVLAVVDLFVSDEGDIPLTEKSNERLLFGNDSGCKWRICLRSRHLRQQQQSSKVFLFFRSFPSISSIEEVLRKNFSNSKTSFCNLNRVVSSSVFFGRAKLED